MEQQLSVLHSCLGQSLRIAHRTRAPPAALGPLHWAGRTAAFAGAALRSAGALQWSVNGGGSPSCLRPVWEHQAAQQCRSTRQYRSSGAAVLVASPAAVPPLFRCVSAAAPTGAPSAPLGCATISWSYRQPAHWHAQRLRTDGPLSVLPCACFPAASCDSCGGEIHWHEPCSSTAGHTLPTSLRISCSARPACNTTTCSVLPLRTGRTGRGLTLSIPQFAESGAGDRTNWK
jgi:hypothetical protein